MQVDRQNACMPSKTTSASICIKHELIKVYLLWIGSGPLGILLLLLRYASSPACPPPDFCAGELVIVTPPRDRAGPKLTPAPLVVATITSRRAIHTMKMTATTRSQHADAPSDLSGRLPI